jgi:hypothetical protein
LLTKAPSSQRPLKENLRLHHFPQMANPGGGAVCNGTVLNHKKQSNNLQRGKYKKNGIVKEAQVRGFHPYSKYPNYFNISL